MRAEEFQKMDELQGSHWWYTSRKRLVEEALSQVYGDRKGLRILDLATACGKNLEHFRGRGQVYGIDVSRESLAYCRGSGEIVLADAMKAPFKEETFDLVLALDALEHFEDDQKALGEIRRILKGGGYLIATVPALMLLWSLHDEAYHHQRRYSRTELMEKLETSGFTVERVTYWTFLLLPAVYLFRKVRGFWRDGEPKSDFHTDLPGFIGRFLEGVQATERAIIARGVALPSGVSLFCTAKKK